MKRVTLDVWLDVIFWGCLSSVLAQLLSLLGLSWSLVFLSAWVPASATCLLRPLLQVTPAGKAVLITGCDSGFGFALAQHLDTLGFRVVAGCLVEESEGAKRLRARASPRLHVLQLDVTSPARLQQAALEVEALIPAGEVLWGLVNNAGLSTFGEVEWVPEDTYRRMLEVNLLGTIAATRAFLPLLRRAKGRVVNMSSMFGRMADKMRSPYVLTKYAVEGFTDCLRYEMRDRGVAVSLIEPGNYVAATGILTEASVRREGEAMWAAMSQRVRDHYTSGYFQRRVAQMMDFTKRGCRDVMPVVEALTSALTEVFPRERYVPAELSLFIRVWAGTHLPERVFQRLYISAARQ